MKNKVRILLIVFVLASMAFTASAAEDSAWKWLDFAEAYPLAMSEGKHLVINFYSLGCGWCRRMDNSTFKDTTVLGILDEGFIGAKLNIASNRRIDWMGRQLAEREIAAIFAGRGVPYTTFIDTTGEVVAALPGYVDAQQFTTILQYVGGYWYRDLTFQEYLISGKLLEAQDDTE
ncbi:MAG TPA: DUF255 domain-containing protein [candidate division Zixibacteria bacterium]|nr:DUF255 domain-containing protein [candidate division Zixibacteria bacterium]